MISCGGFHTAIILGNGDLYTWGQASFGATGTRSQVSQYNPV